MALFLTGRRYLKFGGSMPAINLTNNGDLNVAASSPEYGRDQAIGWSRAMANYATAGATEDRCGEIAKETLERKVISEHDCSKTTR
jgi:hypothetical protein